MRSPVSRRHTHLDNLSKSTRQKQHHSLVQYRSDGEFGGVCLRILFCTATCSSLHNNKPHTRAAVAAESSSRLHFNLAHPLNVLCIMSKVSFGLLVKFFVFTRLLRCCYLASATDQPMVSQCLYLYTSARILWLCK